MNSAQISARWLLASFLAVGAAIAQMPPGPGAAAPAITAPGPLSRDLAQTLMPPTVFFAGKVAPVQGRNTGGAKLPGGLLLAGMVDASGYSSGVQERYQAYLLLDTPVMLGDKRLAPGAYGCGVVKGQFLVLDLGANLLFSIPTLHDAAMQRPTPLQVAPDPAGGTYRLYFGRNYVRFSPAPGGTVR